MKPELEERYSRQMLFRGVGECGQLRLVSARVVIVGCGATGSALASLLARAGVGTLRIIDRDSVEASNLQRQTLFDEADAADSVPKAVAACRRLSSFNSGIRTEAKVSDLVPENAEEMLAGVELVLDGTDNFETRYLINDWAVKHSTPWIYVASVGSQAATMNVIPGETACLSCLFPEAPQGSMETCETEGVLNSAVVLAAALASAEAIKILVGARGELRRTFICHDVWRNQRSEIFAGAPNPACRTCAGHDFIYLAGKRHAHITLCGRNSVQIHEHRRPVDFKDMGRRLAPHGNVRHNEFVLKFRKDPFEMTVFPDGRAIIKGTTDPSVARSLYARYIGH
jgi:adenylyltransferase/sulfurtransferase